MNLQTDSSISNLKYGLYIVSTPIGNLEDITIRALEVLRKSDYILCEDTRVSKKLLTKYKIKSNLISNHKFNEKKNINNLLNFYNERRHQVLEAKPNKAHLALVELESQFDVRIITQNIDDLHERAGSSHVLHLHGEIDFARSSVDETLIYPLNGAEIKLGDRCQKGSQLRPHIVWFGEAVPMMEEVIPLVEMADILLVIGTSLAVYPAAGLVNYAPPYSKKYYIDPQGLEGMKSQDFKVISKKACEGVPKLIKKLMQ